MSEEIAAEFIIENQPPIEAEYNIEPEEPIKTVFELNAQPYKVSQLENDLNFQTADEVAASIQAASDTINARIDDEVAALNTEINKKVETITGDDFINITRNGSAIVINSKTFIFEQAIASNTWVINYDWSYKQPTIDVIDSAGNIQLPNDINYTTGTITLSFLAAFTGKAYLN